jgi:predicted cupin superfamily sugar epimerase
MTEKTPERDTLIHQLHLEPHVEGGTWKASHLSDGNYGLVSEAVSPGFDYRDMTLGRLDALLERFPQHAKLVRAFSRGPESP